MNSRNWLSLGVVFLVAVGGSGPARGAGGGETRDLMGEIFAAFATLVRHVDDPEAFSSTELRGSILDSLKALEKDAERLEAHASRLSAAHEPVGRSLTDDVKRTLDALVLGQEESARFLAGQLVENCFACHSKLPTDHAFPGGARLLEGEGVAQLPPERRALVAVAARQFETALDLYETYLLGNRDSAIHIALSGAFEAYLKVALRVRDDRDRVVRTLAAFRKRGDIPFYLDAEVAGWIRAVQGIGRVESGEDLLVRARGQIQAARRVTVFPGDRRGLVDFVVASRWLHQHLAASPEGAAAHAPEDLSETFLWLGLCEIHISSSLWVSEAESFLESAIRAAPGSEHARTAYSTLEALFLEGYTGSGGTHVPPEVEARLATLRGLIDAPPATTGGTTR